MEPAYGGQETDCISRPSANIPAEHDRPPSHQRTPQPHPRWLSMSSSEWEGRGGFPNVLARAGPAALKASAVLRSSRGGAVRGPTSALPLAVAQSSKPA